MASSSHNSLMERSRQIVATADLHAKVELAYETARDWYSGTLSLYRTRQHQMPDQPGRPEKPELLHPSLMPKRSKGGEKGRIALMHSLAHIELSAVDMTWDLIGRFGHGRMPRAFFDNWVQVGLEEAKHFSLLAKRLEEMGSHYGALPAHAGLWEAAQQTGHDLLARVAIVPLVLEARGLDVTPSTIRQLRAAKDEKSADILEIIYRDEKRHVAFGVRWFRYLCDKERLAAEPTFHALVRKHFRGGLKPPFNDRARAEAGMHPGFYKPLTGISP